MHTSENENHPIAKNQNSAEEWLVNDDDINHVQQCLEVGDYKSLQAIIKDYHSSAQADLIQHLNSREQRIEFARFLTKSLTLSKQPFLAAHINGVVPYLRS